MNQYQSENEFQPKKLHYLTILNSMLSQNSNHFTIKQKIQKINQQIEDLTYSALVESEEKYIEKMGAFASDNENLFSYIGKLINQKLSIFFSEYSQGQFAINSTIKPVQEPELQPPEEIVKEVEHVLANVDLPLSLFKRNDNYWSINNSKTKQAQEYLKRLKQKDEQYKEQVIKKRQEIIKQKQKIRNKTIQINKKQEDIKKKDLKEKIVKKIQQLKINDQNRKKSISQSLQFIKQRGLPLFKKIQKQFKEKVQIPSLNEKKRKLAQLRQIMRSVPLQQIQEHKQRYEKQKSQHQQKTITHQPLNISFKSHFYSQIKSKSLSRFNQMQSNLSLYKKKLDYSQMVKQQHKPAVDENKKNELQSRIKLMNKRRARVKKNIKQTQNSENDDEDGQNQEQQEEAEEEEEEEEMPSSEDEEDDSDKSKPQKDDQYEPSNKQRYKMGLDYLKIAKKLANKKIEETKTNRANTATQNQTISFGQTLDNKQGQQTVEPKKQKFIWVSKYDEEQKKEQRIQYKNYLKEIAKPNQSLDLMDTSRIKKQIQRSLAPLTDRQQTKTKLQKNRKTFDIETEIMYHTNLQNKIRSIEERTKNQQELLKFKRINRNEKIKKKMAIDDAVIDTIKVRLAMMNKTLDH